MPSFAPPFEGNIDRKITKHELIQAIRLDIASELEAMFLYDSHAKATDDMFVRKVLEDIRDEEKAHMGELMTLLKYLDPNWEEMLASGEGEVKEVMEELGIKDSGASKSATVGSLLDE